MEDLDHTLLRSMHDPGYPSIRKDEVPYANEKYLSYVPGLHSCLDDLGSECHPGLSQLQPGSSAEDADTHPNPNGTCSNQHGKYHSQACLDHIFGRQLYPAQHSGYLRAAGNV